MLTEIRRSDRKTFMLKKTGTLFEKYIPMKNVYAASKNMLIKIMFNVSKNIF